MKPLIYFFLSAMFVLCSYTKNVVNAIPEPQYSCVNAEVSTDTISSEGIFKKGDQKSGFASAMKWDKKFDASMIIKKKDLVNFSFIDSSLYLYLFTFWPERFDYSVFGEDILLSPVHVKMKNICYP